MPEIGEIARAVHFLRKNIVSRRIAQVLTTEDSIVYNAKADTTHTSFAAALTGKTVLDARQQGKYFWLVLDSPPHPLFHFGMTGWMKYKGQETFYKSEENAAGEEEEEEAAGEEKDRKATKKDEEWPPKFWKFVLKMEGDPACEAAFVDKRRLARIRLVDAPASEMRNTTPLKENGPDPVVDKALLTPEWLSAKVLSKKVPIKALLLDQAVISGVGNWVGDEVLYHAKIHPEQYSNTLSAAQLAQLHESLMYVCGLACETLSDSSKFPEGWLFKHRWGKGKKGDKVNVLPNGYKIEHLTVGGRTSAIVPAVQKKTGPVAGDVDGEGGGGGGKKAAKKEAAKQETTKKGTPTKNETPAKNSTTPTKRKRKTISPSPSPSSPSPPPSSPESDSESEPPTTNPPPKKKAKPTPKAAVSAPPTPKAQAAASKTNGNTKGKPKPKPKTTPKPKPRTTVGKPVGTREVEKVGQVEKVEKEDADAGAGAGAEAVGGKRRRKSARLTRGG